LYVLLILKQMRHEEKNKKVRQVVKSSMDVALEAIGGKWKLLIVHLLLEEPQRPHQLLCRLPGASERMLLKQLREMETDLLVTRTVFAAVPPKVEYALTEHGKTLVPLIRLLNEWGQAHVQAVYPQRNIHYKVKRLQGD
jgi:DNA-binding HxlR family transcriptional regulator